MCITFTILVSVLFYIDHSETEDGLVGPVSATAKLKLATGFYVFVAGGIVYIVGMIAAFLGWRSPPKSSKIENMPV